MTKLANRLLSAPTWLVCVLTAITQYVVAALLLSAYASRRGVGAVASGVGVAIEFVQFPSQQILVPIYRRIYGPYWFSEAHYSAPFFLLDAIVWASLIGLLVVAMRQHLTGRWRQAMTGVNRVRRHF